MNAVRDSSSPRSSCRRRTRRADGGRRGFALLITITFLAFLVLLLVSLASLTRVETQVAANNRQLSQARQNALMALNIAIGELQKYAGPDQRTTARADIDASLANVTNRNGRWTGVYGSAVAADYTDTPSEISDKLAAVYDGADPLLKKGSQARLLNWLVSGNEAVAFNPATDVAADGHITAAPTSFMAAPTDAVDLTTAEARPSAAASQALLVGAHSVGAPSDYVTAPLVDIAIEAGAAPGVGGPDPVTIGRYAWWVGDEGAKARINLSASTATHPAHAFVTAQRAAIELVDGVHAVGITPASFDTDDLIGASYDPSSAAIPRLLDAAQLPMLSPAHAATLEAARKFRFHDLTATSQSVLSDTYAGGLKKDLSAMLATGATFPADDDYLFTPASNNARDTYGVPTWGKLRSFAQTTSGVDPLEPRLPSATDVGVYPVLTYAAAGFQYVNLGGSLRLAVFPAIVLWNPYTAPIKGVRYEFGINSSGGRFQLQASTDGTTWVGKETRNLTNGVRLQGDGVAKSYLRFEIDATAEDLQPGESRIFTLQGAQSGVDYNAPTDDVPTNVLTPGLNILGHVLIPDAGTVVAPGETHFRVAGDGSAHVVPIGANFRNEMSAYLGQLASVAPVGPEMPAAGKPWYQIIARVAVGGSPASPILQSAPTGFPPGVTGSDLWGISVQMSFGNRVRWIANNNVRAPFMSRTNLTGTRAVISKQGKSDYFQLFSFDPSPDGHASSSTASSSASGLDVNTTTDEPIDSILFEFRPSDQPLLSLGQLQHANLSWHQDIPAYPLGNSLADMFHLNPNKTDRDRLHRASSGSQPPTNLIGGQYDISYLLNRSLWDRYFVSTVPHAGTGVSGDANTTAIPDILPYSRHRHDRSADLRDADKAAAHLRLTGGFNINSTSEQAWRAILGGINQLEYTPETATAASGSPLAAALPRFAKPPSAPAYDPTRPDWAFKGYRSLTEEQIAQLAKDLVREVRNRGPFVSLADFVNRRLKDNPDSETHGTPSPATLKSDETMKGPLQAAIDATTSGGASINGYRQTPPFNGALNSDPSTDNDGEALVGGLDTDGESVIPFGAKAAFAPQFLTQADVLSAIGAGLSARSDTFTVRTYGDVMNPVTGDVTGRAWCEAVVQRVVEPVRRKSTIVTSADYNEPAVATAAQPDFGRRFQIISFRWLSSTDI